eukprot:scaffold24048_cov194-Amphora_coffeaeformis.AAC.17
MIYDESRVVATRAAVKIKAPPTFSRRVVSSPNKRRANMAVKTGSKDKTMFATVADTVAWAFCCQTSANMPGPAALYSKSIHVTTAPCPVCHPNHWACPVTP